MKSKKWHLTICFILFSPIFFCSFNFFGEPKPDYFGIYLVENNELINLSGENSLYKKDVIPERCINDQKAYIIIYDDELSYKDIELNVLKYQIIKMSSDKSYKHWTKFKDINLKVFPIDNKPNMYKLIPGDYLGTGFYCINSNNSSYYFCVGDCYHEMNVSGIKVDGALLYQFRFNGALSKKDQSAILLKFDAKIQDNFHNIFYGIYPAKDNKNRFYMLTTITGNELKNLNYKEFDLTLLEEKSIQGQVGFKFENGGSFIEIMFMKNPMVFEQLEKKLNLSNQSFINILDNHYMLHLSPNEFYNLHLTTKDSNQFLNKKLGDPGVVSYDFASIEVGPRLNAKMYLR